MLPHSIIAGEGGPHGLLYHITCRGLRCASPVALKDFHTGWVISRKPQSEHNISAWPLIAEVQTGRPNRWSGPL
jgi:hypothetical protein